MCNLDIVINSDVIDSSLADTFSSFLSQILKVITTFGIILYATPWFGLIIIPILGIYLYIQNFYLKSTREIKRLESISSSPMYFLI